MFMGMLFLFLFFLGCIAMFCYLNYKQDTLWRNLSDEHAQLRVLMRAMESRLEHIETSCRFKKDLENQSISNDENSQPENPEDVLDAETSSNYDTLLHLSFEDLPQKHGAKSSAMPEINLDPLPDSKTREATR